MHNVLFRFRCDLIQKGFLSGKSQFIYKAASNWIQEEEKKKKNGKAAAESFMLLDINIKIELNFV